MKTHFLAFLLMVSSGMAWGVGIPATEPENIQWSIPVDLKIKGGDPLPYYGMLHMTETNSTLSMPRVYFQDIDGYQELPRLGYQLRQIFDYKTIALAREEGVVSGAMLRELSIELKEFRFWRFGGFASVYQEVFYQIVNADGQYELIHPTVRRQSERPRRWIDIDEAFHPRRKETFCHALLSRIGHLIEI